MTKFWGVLTVSYIMCIANKHLNVSFVSSLFICHHFQFKANDYKNKIKNKNKPKENSPAVREVVISFKKMSGLYDKVFYYIKTYVDLKVDTHNITCYMYM